MSDDGPAASRENTPQPLYQEILGSDYGKLPPLVRAMHDVADRVIATGTATVTRGGNPFARVLASSLGLPPAGTDYPATVRFERFGDTERLTRRYGQHEFFTTQRQGLGPDAGNLAEAFGPVALVIRLDADHTGLRFNLIGARLAGMPLPRFLWPRLEARETEADGWYRFSVRIGLPLIGLLIHYEGKLRIETPKP